MPFSLANTEIVGTAVYEKMSAIFYLPPPIIVLVGEAEAAKLQLRYCQKSLISGVFSQFLGRFYFFPNILEGFILGEAIHRHYIRHVLYADIFIHIFIRINRGIGCSQTWAANADGAPRPLRGTSSSTAGSSASARCGASCRACRRW